MHSVKPRRIAKHLRHGVNGTTVRQAGRCRPCDEATVQPARRSGTAPEAVILAGGQGIRLRPYTSVIPKPLVPIGNECSLLEIVLRQLAARGFLKATVSLGYLGHLVEAYVGDGSQWGIEVACISEEAPLGTVGPVLKILDQLPDHFLLMNGDILTDLDYADLLVSHSASGSPLTLATYEREVRVDFGVLTLAERRVTGFTEKPTIRCPVSMGVNAVAKTTLASYQPGEPLGMDQVVLDLLSNGHPPTAYPFSGYWMDIGRPDDYDRANLEFPTIRHELLLP